MIFSATWKILIAIQRTRTRRMTLMDIQMLLVLMTPLLTPRTSVCVTLLSSDWSSSSTSSSSHSVLFSKFLWTRQSKNTWGCIIRLVITHHPQLHLHQHLHHHQHLQFHHRWNPESPSLSPSPFSIFSCCEIDLKLSNSEIIHLCCKIPFEKYGTFGKIWPSFGNKLL